jgi:hypothetical protein
MLDSFLTWLDDYLAGEPPSAIVRAIIGLLSFAALLGVVFGDIAVRTGALAAAVFLVLASVLLLLADRRRMSRDIEDYRNLLTRYCDFINDDRRPVMRISRLEHVVVLDRNGDATELITMHVIALNEGLYFIPLRFGPGWDQPPKYRRQIKVVVRSLLVDGNLGTSWAVTKSWLPDGRLNLLSHLNAPASLGSEVRLEMDRVWPGKCIPLMREHRPDSFTLKFTCTIDYASYTIVMPPGVDVYYDPIGFTEGDADISLTRERNREGRVEVVLTGTDIAMEREIGVRLELK